MSNNENSDRLSQAEIDEAWNIFVEEAEEHLGIIENALLSLESNPDDMETVKQLFRSLHTVKGMAGLQGLGGLHRLSHKTEDVVGLARGGGAVMDSFMIDLLLEATDAIKIMVVESITSRTCSQPSEELLGRLENLCLQHQHQDQTASSSSPEADITEIFDPAESECAAQDPDTIAYFLSMAAEEFHRLREGVHALKSGDPGWRTAIVQAVETISFAAGQMGYDALVDALATLGSFAAKPSPEAATASYAEAGTALLWTVKERLAELGVAIDDGENALPVEKKPCPDVSPSLDPDPLTEQLAPVDGELPAPKDQALASGHLETLTTLVGQLVGSSSMMEHVIARLAGRELKADLTRLARQNGQMPAEGGSSLGKAPPDLSAILDAVDEDYRTLETHYAQLKSTLDRLQDFSAGLRLRPVAAILDSLPAFAADLASQLNKQVVLDIEGAAIKIDQSTLVHVSELATELLGWILIHDMEQTEERVRLGKPQAGRIDVKILQNGNSVQVIVESDGRGVDQGQIAAHDIPGMDFAAVNHILHTFRGGLIVAQGATGGVRFVVHIPLSQNVMDGIIVRVGKVRYIVPLDAVRQIMRPEPGQVISSSINGGKSLNLQGEIIPLRFLAGEEGNGTASHALWERMVVVVDAARQPTAFPIDEIVGQQQVLINPLKGFMKEIRCVAGCSILGGGEVGLILDVDAMAAGFSALSLQKK